jgi:4-alpha-glucanotransferase
MYDALLIHTTLADYASRWIAEDIGTREDVPDGGKVVKLRNDLKLMGMKLLQLAFYYKLYSDQLDLGNWHLPHHHLPEYVVYSGSHDSQTVLRCEKTYVDGH